MAYCGHVLKSGVAQVGEGGIGHEPVFVVVHEGEEVGVGEDCFSFLLVGEAEVVHLELYDGFVVYLGESVELLLLHHELLHGEAVIEAREGVDVAVEGMEGEDGDGVVGVGVFPVSVHHGVVDGQYLDGVHACLDGPLYHGLEVAEVAHSVALGGAEGEDGDDNSCCLPAVAAEGWSGVGLDPHLAWL